MRQFVSISPVPPGAGPLDTLGHPGGGQVDPGVGGSTGWRVVVGHGGGGVGAGAEAQVPDHNISCRHVLTASCPDLHIGNTLRIWVLNLFLHHSIKLYLIEILKGCDVYVKKRLLMNITFVFSLFWPSSNMYHLPWEMLKFLHQLAFVPTWVQI